MRCFVVTYEPDSDVYGPVVAVASSERMAEDMIDAIVLRSDSDFMPIEYRDRSSYLISSWDIDSHIHLPYGR